MDDLLKNYLTQKYGEGYEQKAKEDLESAQTQNKWANFASNLGDAIAGNKVGSANQYFQGLNQEAKASTVGKYEKAADQYVKDKTTNAQLKDFITKEELDKAQADPASRQSVLANALAKKFNLPVQEGDSYKDISQFMDPKKMMETEAASNVDFEKQKALRRMDQSFKKEENELNRKIEIEKLNAKASKAGQDALDKDFAKDYNDWTSGGAKSAQSEIKKLQGVIDNLKDGKVTTGGLTGVFPDRVTSDKVLSARSDVQSTVMNSLRAILGPQFTEKEGERIIKNTWNEADSTKNNIARLDRLVNDLKNQAEDKNQKSMFYEQNKTLSGYKPIIGNSQQLVNNDVSQDEKYQKAFQWAQNNPDDPRAEAIMKKISTKVAGK